MVIPRRRLEGGGHEPQAVQRMLKMELEGKKTEAKSHLLRTRQSFPEVAVKSPAFMRDFPHLTLFMAGLAKSTQSWIYCLSS